MCLCYSLSWGHHRNNPRRLTIPHIHPAFNTSDDTTVTSWCNMAVKRFFNHAATFKSDMLIIKKALADIKQRPWQLQFVCVSAANRRIGYSSGLLLLGPRRLQKPRRKLIPVMEATLLAADCQNLARPPTDTRLEPDCLSSSNQTYSKTTSVAADFTDEHSGAVRNAVSCLGSVVFPDAIW